MRIFFFAWPLQLQTQPFWSYQASRSIVRFTTWRACGLVQFVLVSPFWSCHFWGTCCSWTKRPVWIKSSFSWMYGIPQLYILGMILCTLYNYTNMIYYVNMYIFHSQFLASLERYFIVIASRDDWDVVSIENETSTLWRKSLKMDLEIWGSMERWKKKS